MALRFEENRSLDLETKVAAMDLQADTAADLPALGATVAGGFVVGFGSIAQVITTGKWYTLTSGGVWIDRDGQEPPAEEEAAET